MIVWRHGDVVSQMTLEGGGDVGMIGGYIRFEADMIM